MFNVDITKLPVLGSTISWLKSNGMDYGIHVTVISLFILYAMSQKTPQLLSSGFTFFLTLAPIWFPALAFSIFHLRWMDYVHKMFYLKNGRTQFRIKIPQEVLKSPEAMELVLTQIWNVQNPDNYWQTYIDGKTPLPTTLEIVSIGGEVRFYINTYTKKGVETLVPAIYSQYPGIELVEEPVDYAAEIGANFDDWELFSVHFGKKEKKWGPIKTYIEFGLDKMPKEEEKVDPITPLIENLASLSSDERVFVQFALTAHRPSSFVNGQLMWPWLGEGPKWTKDAQARVDEIMKRDPETKGTVADSEDDGVVRLTPGERNDVEAIERNMNKYAFNFGGRYLYCAKKGKFNPSRLNSFNRMLSQTDVIGRGSIGVRWRTDFDYMWFSDPFGERLQGLKKVEYKLFQLRKYVNHAQTDNSTIFTTEEIATLFHMPGKVALTPTLDRIPSTRSEAPTNLPTGTLPTL